MKTLPNDLVPERITPIPARRNRARLIAAILGIAVAAGNLAGGLACSGWRQDNEHRLEPVSTTPSSVPLAPRARR